MVELDVADLAVRAGQGEDPKYPYRSLGVKEYVSKIRLAVDHYKGDLHYTAEFIPAVHLKGVSFGNPKNQVQEALDASSEGEVNGGVFTLGSHEDNQKVPPGVTITLPKHKQDQVDSPIGTSGTPTSPNGNKRASSPASAKTEEEGGVELSKEELLKSRTYSFSTFLASSELINLPRGTASGIIVFDIISGHLARRARLEILMDDGYWPVFVTPKARSTDTKWDMVGEGFIKELDFGRVWLRLNESEDLEKEDITAEFKSDAKQFLERALVSHPLPRKPQNYHEPWTDLLMLRRIPPLSLSSVIKMAGAIVSLPLRPSLSPFPSYSVLAKASTVSEPDLLSPNRPD